MAKVSINIIKDWFKNQMKPPQEQFWSWLDSFWHKDEPIPQSAVENLVTTLQKKADLVNGVVPESQLPFSVVTSEVITLGSVELIDNKTYLRLHSSGANKVRVKGKLITRTFQNKWTITPIVADGVKVLRGYAVKNNDDFLLAEGAELPTYEEPEIPEDALEIFKITMRSSGNVIEQTESGLKYIAEDGWKNLTIDNDTGVYLTMNSPQSSFEINVTESSVTPKILGLFTQTGINLWDGKPLVLWNNSSKTIQLPVESQTISLLPFESATALKPGDFSIIKIYHGKLIALKLPSDPFKLDKPLTPNNTADRVVLGNGSTKPLSELGSLPSGGNDDEVLIKAGTTGIWSSFVKGIEFLGNAWLKLKLISFQGYTIAQKNAIASPQEGMLIYQNESPKGFQKYEGGAWTAIGSNISNADLSNVSARTFTQGNSFTWNTGGFGYFWKGLVDKTGNAAYSKSLIIHPTTGETVTRDFADPAATTLAVQNANATQKTAMRTALLGTATPANPVLQDASSRFIQPGVNLIDLIGLNLTLLDPTFLWIEKPDLTKVFATNFYNVSGTVVTSVWDIPADLPNGNYSIKIQNGVTVQGLSNAVFTKVDSIVPTTLTASNWKRAVRKLDDGITDANTWNGSNTAADNILSITSMGINGTLNQTGVIAKYQNIFLGSKDWDFDIMLQSTAGTTNALDWSTLIGLTETTHADFNNVENIIKNNYVMESTATSIRLNSSNAPILTGGNPGQFWWIYFSKVGDKLYVRMYNKNNMSNFQYWQYSINTSKDYALYFAGLGFPGSANTIKTFWITARIMN
ncbi:hypothetical protein FNJ88_06255 [Chryseobacterium sp. SNU WT5]|uniref:hypothetical protein n=1 Tax=Chryseobacterium sp. SNU WT5 TaxID=2594269 RepID=UPI00117D9ED6|nr:hypothetical protein [Chryseobacterium sp. SNU WT5]QDP85184.1 hypothetical protein FNJ88_06255 [Chryseobacterium sp. SNU WT5]